MNQESAGDSRLSLPPLEEIARQLGATTSEAGTFEAGTFEAGTSEAGAAEEGSGQAPDDDAALAAMADEFVAGVVAGADEGSLARQRRAVDEVGVELEQVGVVGRAWLGPQVCQL